MIVLHFSHPVTDDQQAQIIQLAGVARSCACVVVLYAGNPENNLASKWNEGIKQGYLHGVQRTYEHIRQAQDGERRGDEQGAMNAWCHVFGNEFRRLSQ